MLEAWVSGTSPLFLLEEKSSRASSRVGSAYLREVLAWWRRQFLFGEISEVLLQFSPDAWEVKAFLFSQLKCSGWVGESGVWPAELKAGVLVSQGRVASLPSSLRTLRTGLSGPPVFGCDLLL